MSRPTQRWRVVCAGLGIWSVEFSPVERCVITSSGDRTVKIWHVPDGSCLKTFEGHTSSVLRASFLSRGTQFVSCGSDGLVKLWTIKTNECIATYDKHDGKEAGVTSQQKIRGKKIKRSYISSRSHLIRPLSATTPPPFRSYLARPPSAIDYGDLYLRHWTTRSAAWRLLIRSSRLHH